MRAVNNPIKTKMATRFRRINLANAFQKPVENNLNIPNFEVAKGIQKRLINGYKSSRQSLKKVKIYF
jgi:hypothetical protein